MFDANLPTHPRTGLAAIGWTSRGPIWPVKGGDGTGGDDGGSAGSGGDGGSGSGGGAGDGFTPITSQDDFDKRLQDRLRRATAKYADYDDLKAKADKHDALEAELATDKDKAVKAARDEERSKAHGEFAPRLVRAEFKAAAKGVLSDDQLTALLEDLDLSKYVTDKGEVDEERIGKKVKAFAPTDTGGGGNGRPLGQGKQPPANAKPGDAGRAMAEKRFGPQKAAATK